MRTFDEIIKQRKANNNTQISSSKSSASNSKKSFDSVIAERKKTELLSEVESLAKNRSRFVDEYNSRYFDAEGNSIQKYRSDSEEWYNKTTNNQRNLSIQERDIRYMLSQYGKYYDEDFLKSVNSVLDSDTNVFKQIVDQSASERDYYSQWADEDTYNRAMIYAKEQEAKTKKYASMTDDELKAEIKKLEESKRGNKLSNLVTKYIGTPGIAGSTDRQAKAAVNIKHNDSVDYEISLIEQEQTNRKYNQIDVLPENVKSLIDELTVIESTNDDKEFANKVNTLLSGFTGGSNVTYNVGSNTERHTEITQELEKMGVDNWQELVAYNKLRYNAEKNASTKAGYAEMAKEHPILSSFVSVPASLGKGLGTLEKIEKIGSDAPLDPNSPYFGVNDFVNTVRETVNNEHDFHLNTGNETIDSIDINDEIYNIVMSSGDSAMAGVSTLGLSPIQVLSAGGAILGLSAASEKEQEVSVNGGSADKAIMSGIAAGINEMLWEALSLGALDDVLTNGVIKRGFGGFVKSLVKSAGINASEEFNTEAANLFTDYLINGGASEYAKAIQNSLSAGYTEEEAKANAEKVLLTQMAKAGVSGALQGLFMGGVAGSVQGARAMGHTVANGIVDRQYYNQMGKNIVTNEGVQDVVDKAKDIPALRRLAAQVEGVKTEDLTSDKGVKKYEKQVGKLYKGVTRSQVQQLSKIKASETETESFKNIVFEKLESAGVDNADKVADIVVKKALDSEKLTREETALFNSINGEALIDTALKSEKLVVDEGGDFSRLKNNVDSVHNVAKFNKTNSIKRALLSETDYQISRDGKTSIRSSGDEVESFFITSVNDDDIEVNVKSEKGQQVMKASNLSLSPDYAILFEGFKKIKSLIGLDENTGNKLLSLWETYDGDAFEFYKAVESGLMYGRYNLRDDFENSYFAQTLSKDTRDMVFAMGQEYGERTKKDFVESMDTPEKAKAASELYKREFGHSNDFKTAFNIYYDAGLKGIDSFSKVDKNNTFAHSFPKDWRESVFNAGRRNRMYKPGVNKLYEKRNLSQNQKGQLKVLDMLGKKYGISFLVFDTLNNSGNELNGMQIAGTNKVAVSLEADGKLYLRTAGHECLHVIEEWNPESAAELTDKVINYLKQTEGYNYAEQVKRYAKTYGADASTSEGLSLIHSEMAADSMFDVFSNEKFIKDIVTENRTLAQKIKDFFIDLVSELRKMMSHFNKSEEMNALRNQTAALEDINASFISALETATKNMQETLSDETKNTATKDGVRYSVSGVRSKTADTSLMLKAKNMLDSGINSETVRKETGWYIGYDNKMRYEIDDSKMTLIRQGDEIINYGMLDELIKHDDLFEAYPELKYMSVYFQDLGGKLGSYSRQFRDINIDSSLKNKPGELKNVLVHEIQHAIQHIEKFTGGSSESYWEKQLKNNSDVGKTGEQKQELENLETAYYKIEKEKPEFFKEMLELFEMEPGIPRGKIDWDTLEKIEEDPIEWQHFDKKRDSISEKYGDNEVYNFFRLRDKIKNLKSNSKTARDLYWGTAGEIEARDTSNRLDYTAEQRKNIRPDIDRTDVVFADSSDIGFSLGRTTDNTPVVVVNDDILRNITTEKELIDIVKFSLGRFKRVPIKGQSIYFLRDTKKEYTNSGYTKWLKNNDSQVYQDKMRLAGHTQDIVYATTDYINEGLKHPRKDNIIDFARGNILIDVLGRKYSAEVVIGFTKKGICELHDIVRLTSTNFEYKKEAVTEAMDSKESNRSVTTSDNNNISQDISVVNNNSMHNDSDDSKTRRSIKLTQKSQQVLDENPELKNVLQDLQNELSLTKGYVPEGKVIHKYAVQLKKDNSCSMNVAEIERDLREIYSVLSSMSGSEGYEYAADLTLDLAKRMLDSSRVLDDLNAEKKELRQKLTSVLKGHKWYLSPQMRSEIEYHYDSYGNFHKKLFGKGFSFSENSTDYLDSDWSDLCAAVPELLDSDTPAAEQPLAILEAFSATEYDYGLFDEYQYSSQAKYIATDIMDNLAAVPEADTMIGKIKASEYDRIAQLKRDNTEKIKELKKKYAEDIERTARKEKTHYKLQIKRKLESEKAAKARKSIETTMVRLSGMLANGKKNRHVPLKLIDTVYDLCYSITLNRASQTQLGNNLEKIEALYAALNAGKEGADGKTNDQFSKNAYDKYVHNLIHNLNEQLKHKSIGDMTLEELILVDETVKAVAQRVARGNELHIESKNEGVEETVQAIFEELGAPKIRRDFKYKIFNKISDDFDFEKWNFLKPAYAWRMMGSDTFSDLMSNIRKGEDVLGVDISEAREKFLEMSKKYNKTEWENQSKQIKFDSGETFTLSVQQLMMLYAASQREQFIPHLIGHKRGEKSTVKGGFIFEDAYKAISENPKNGKKGMFREFDANTHHLTENDLDLIADALTSEQRAYANEMRDYLANDCAVKGNEVTRRLYDMNKFVEDKYFPIKVAQENLDSNLKDADVKSVLGSTVMKDLQEGANNSVVLREFDDVWDEHVQQMAMFHSFALPLDDFSRVFNWKSNTGKVSSMISKIETACGKGAVRYIENFIKDVNGGIKSQSSGTWVTKSISLFKKTAVAASASVVVQQPTAIVRAWAMIDPKYFVHGKDSLKHKEAWEELKKHAPIAIIKEMGGFDVGGGKQNSEYIKAKEYKGIKSKAKGLLTDSVYRDEMLMKGASVADEIGWISIWNAVKNEITKTTTHKVGSDEFFKACSERFTDIITYTQVYDSVFSRSGFMRNKGEIAKMATSFMGEPTTSFNMLFDAVMQLARGEISWKKSTRIIGATIASVILAAVAKSFIYALRDDDEDESYAEKYAQALTNSLSEDIWIHNMLPFVSDITSLLSGWDVERTDMAIFKDIWDAINDIDSPSKSTYRKIEDLAGAFAALFGFPAKNLMRTGREMYNAVANILDNNTADIEEFGTAAWDGLEESFYNSFIVEKITGGYKGGNSTSDVNVLLDKGKNDKAKELIDEIVSEKVEDGKTENEARSSVKSSVTSYWKERYLQAYRDKDDEEMLRIRKLLKSTGLYDDVVKTCSDWVKSMSTEEKYKKW